MVVGVGEIDKEGVTVGVLETDGVGHTPPCLAVIHVVQSEKLSIKP